MSDENLRSCLHLMYHGWKAAHHIQVFPSIRADAKCLTTNLNVNKYLLYFHNTTFLCVFTRGKCIICLFPYITLSLAHYFNARVQCFSETNIFVSQHNIPVFTSRKRLVCFLPYITLSLAHFFECASMVFFGNTHLCFTTQHSCVFTSRKRLVCFIPYI